MKKQFLALALVAVLGISGAFATKQSPVKTQTESEYTYYEEGICDVAITCDDSFQGPLCSEAYENTVLYYQPGCQVLHQVTSPLGRLPQ